MGQLNPEEVTEESLQTRFQEYGQINNVNLIKRINPTTNRPIAFAFIAFDNEQSARRAIEHAVSDPRHRIGMFFLTGKTRPASYSS